MEIAPEIGHHLDMGISSSHSRRPWNDRTPCTLNLRVFPSSRSAISIFVILLC
jgi:hypothetical protein